MRILHVLPSINNITGGPAKSIPLQLASLAKLGHHVDLFTTRWPDLELSTKPSVYKEKGVTIHIFPATPLWPLYHVPYSRSLIAAIRNTRGQYDIYQSSSLWNPLATHAMVLFRRYKLPYTITCHGMMDPLVFARHRVAKWCWHQLWERRNFEHAEAVQFTSEMELQKAQNSAWKIRRSLVMPISVEVSAGLELPQRTQIESAFPQLIGKEVVLFVGRINWVKNLDLLLAALARLRQLGRDVVLLCVGPDSDHYQQVLEKQAKQLGVESALVFAGLLEGDALKAAFSRADVAALVSRKENFGLAAAEALAAGVPIVLSDGVDMGKHWVAPPVWRVTQDIESISHGLSHALDFSKTSGTPCESARQLARLEWGQLSVQPLVDIFEEILRSKRAN